MSHITPTPEQFEAFAALAIEGPIYMVNLLKFKPNGGRESYARYAELLTPHLHGVGGKVVSDVNPQITVVGDDQWDQVIVVYYPSKQAFMAMVSLPEYSGIAENRTNALVDSRLYCSQANEG